MAKFAERSILITILYCDVSSLLSSSHLDSEKHRGEMSQIYSRFGTSSMWRNFELIASKNQCHPPAGLAFAHSFSVATLKAFRASLKSQWAITAEPRPSLGRVYDRFCAETFYSVIPYLLFHLPTRPPAPACGNVLLQSLSYSRHHDPSSLTSSSLFNGRVT